MFRGNATLKDFMQLTITTQYYIMLHYVSRVLKIEDMNKNKPIFRVAH